MGGGASRSLSAALHASSLSLFRHPTTQEETCQRMRPVARRPTRCLYLPSDPSHECYLPSLPVHFRISGSFTRA